jgi:hypothetical protein
MPGIIARRINTICHRTGLALALVPLAMVAWVAAASPRRNGNPDDRSEVIGSLLFLCFAACVAYIVPRVIGWVTAALVEDA